MEGAIHTLRAVLFVGISGFTIDANSVKNAS